MSSLVRYILLFLQRVAFLMAFLTFHTKEKNICVTQGKIRKLTVAAVN